MKRVVIIIATCLSVIGLILLGTFFYYQNNVDKILEQSQEAAVYDRHFLFISSDTTGMWQDFFRSASEAAADSGAYLEWCGRETSGRYSDADAIGIGIAQNVDGILLYENDGRQLKEAIASASKKEIPVVTLLRDVDDSERVSYVGFSNYEKGKLYGEQLATILHEGDNRICLLTDSGDSESELNLLYSQITQIVRQSAPAEDKISLSSVRTDSSTDFEVEETVRNLLMGNDVPDILICETAVQTDCAIQTIIDNNLVDQVQVIGNYTADGTLSAIQRELIPATVTINTDALGNDSVSALNEYLDFGHVSDYYNISLQTVTRSNVYQFIRNKNLGKESAEGGGSR